MLVAPSGAEGVSMRRMAQDTLTVNDPVPAHADGKYQRILLRGRRDNANDATAAEQPSARGRQRDRDQDWFGG